MVVKCNTKKVGVLGGVVGFWLSVEEKPEPQDVDDDHQQAIRLNQPEPSFRPVNDPHQPDVHHNDRPQSRERMR